MRQWLKKLDDLDCDCVLQYEYLLGRKLAGRDEYAEIDGQVDEMILEWTSRGAFFAAYPELKAYAKTPAKEQCERQTASPENKYAGMLPAVPKPGCRGYYPVTSREEWEALPALYKAMEWTPAPDIRDNGRLKAVKGVIFDVAYLKPYGIRAKVTVHPEDVQSILFCSFEQQDCHLYSVCGVELEGGSRLPAKWLQDTTTGAFGIFANDVCVGRQGGFQGYIPEHIHRTKDGSFSFDFQYGVGKTVHYALHNPFPPAPKRISLEEQISRLESQKPDLPSVSQAKDSISVSAPVHRQTEGYDRENSR